MHAFSSGLHIVIRWVVCHSLPSLNDHISHSSLRTNLMIEKTCRVNLNFTGEICDDIEHHSAESDRVQQDVTDLNLYNTFLSAIPWSEANIAVPSKLTNRNIFSIIISLMIGPLSDRYGRRPVLLFPMIGQIIGQVGIHVLKPELLVDSISSDRVSPQCLLLGGQGWLPPLRSLLLPVWWQHHLPHRTLLLPGRHHQLGQQDLPAVCAGCVQYQWVHRWDLPLRSSLSESWLLWNLRNNSRDLLPGLLLRSFLPCGVQVLLLMRTRELNIIITS